MARILVDSDVLVDHLRGHRRFVRGQDDVHVSVVTRAELFAGRATDERRIRRLLVSMPDLVVDAAVAERAGRIRRTASVRLPDALIAATAIEHRLKLVTRNAGNFAGIKGLKLRAPSFQDRPSFTPGQFDGRVRVGDDFDDPLPDEILDAFEGRP